MSNVFPFSRDCTIVATHLRRPSSGTQSFGYFLAAPSYTAFVHSRGTAGAPTAPTGNRLPFTVPSASNSWALTVVGVGSGASHRRAMRSKGAYGVRCIALDGCSRVSNQRHLLLISHSALDHFPIALPERPRGTTFLSSVRAASLSYRAPALYHFSIEHPRGTTFLSNKTMVG